MYQIERIETTIIKWLGEIGGFWAIFAVSLALVDQLDDVTLYVISDLLKPYKSPYLQEAESQEELYVDPP